MDRTRLLALLCLAAGVLGFASAAALALVEPSVSEERFSFPLTAAGFTAVQVWFAVHHLGLLAGLLALPRVGAVPPGGATRWGWRASVAGMVGLTVTELVAITGAGDDADSALVGAIGGLYGVTCTAVGVGLVVLGAALVRARRWAGRWVVLALGIWVFVPMFPAFVLTPTDGARWAIGGWMLLFAGLGAALLSPAARPAAVQPA